MSGRMDCFTEDELLELLELPAHDPRHAHVRTCPRCQARIADHASFLRGGTEAETPGLAAVERRMAAALRAEMDRAAMPATPDAGAAPARARRHASGRVLELRRWLSGGRLPAWAAAAAAIVVVAGALFALRPRSWEGDVLRETPSDGRAATELRVRPARLEGGQVHLSWDAVPGADSYLVLSLTPDLGERARFGPFTATEATLPADSLRGASARGSPAAWQIVARRGGDIVARSPIRTLNTAR